MDKRLLLASLATGIIFLLATSPGFSQDKLQFATAVKTATAYYLPILAAEEKGFWKENGLEVEWIPVGTSVGMYHAITAGSLNIGVDVGAALIPAMARGVPAVIVANVQNYLATVLWVRTDSPIKEPKELRKGARVGVVSIGGTDHAYGRMLLRALGMEKDVRFVSTGGIPNSMAALKVGAVDATTMTWWMMFPLEAKREVRAIARQEDHIRMEILAHPAWVRKDYLKSSPQVISRVIKALLQSTAFVAKNRDWALEKIKVMQGVGPEAAEAAYKRLDYSKDGKISREVMENTRKFLIEYELMPKDKAPPVEELYTQQFTG